MERCRTQTTPKQLQSALALRRLRRLVEVVERSVAAFVKSWRRQLRRIAAGVVLAGCLVAGWAPAGSAATTTATTRASGATAITTVMPAISKGQASSAASKHRLVLLATNLPRGQTAAVYPSAASDEQERGLVQLKRNLLREGIDPYRDWEGQRQVHFYSTGVDLAGGAGIAAAAPWSAASSASATANADAKESPRQFVERHLERAQGHYLPQSAAAHRLRHQRRVLRCVVQDLEARGVDPLRYLERNPHHVQTVLQLSGRHAEKLSALYNRNLQRYGRIMNSRIWLAGALERNLLAPILPRPKSTAPPAFRDYLLPSASFSSSRSRAPDWFDDSDAKAAAAETEAASHGERIADSAPTSAHGSKPKSRGKQRSRKKVRKEERTAKIARSPPTSSEAVMRSSDGSSSLAGADAATTPSSSSPLLGTLRKTYAVPVAGLLLLGAAAWSLSSGRADPEDDDVRSGDRVTTTGSDLPPQSGQELDFQRLYTLLTGDAGSYKSRAQPPGADQDVQIRSSSSSSSPPPERKPIGDSPTQESQDSGSGSPQSSASPLFTRWMPHRRYQPLGGGSLPREQEASGSVQPNSQERVVPNVVDAPSSQDAPASNATAAVSSTAGDSSTAAAVTMSNSTLEEALAMSRSMSVAELATMEIPTSFKAGSVEPERGSPTRPRDLFDFLSTIQDDKTNEFARQLAKLLALGAPAEFFWHVHSLSGGQLPVDVTSSSVGSIKRFLLGAREAAGIDATDARQLFDDVKRCMMTDLMELESRLLQGPTTTDAIHHVVDFMAHVSTVNDALVESFALPVAVAPGSNVTVDESATTMSSTDNGVAWIFTNSTVALAPDRSALAPLQCKNPASTTDVVMEGSTNDVSSEAPSRPSEALDLSPASISTKPDSGSTPPEKQSQPPMAQAPVSVPSRVDDALRPTYNESYASIRSFLEKLQDTYTGTGGLL